MPTKSIILAPGESAVLPAGATVVSISNPAFFTSVNDCAVKDLQDLKCYIFVLVGHRGNGLVTQTFPWETPNASIIGITVNGINYPLTTTMDSAGRFDVGAVGVWINNNPTLQGLFIDISVASALGDNGNLTINRGAVTTMCFKTIPSVAKDMYLNVGTVLPNTVNGAATEDWRVYPVPYAEYTGDGKCACSVG
jgi:hypothetical protein